MITAVNGEAVSDSHDLARKIAALGPKKDAELTVVRNGSTETVKVTLGSMSDERQAKADAPEQRGKDAMAKYGMALEPATAVEGAGKTGVVVAEVDPDGAAAQKGIQTGDVILAVGGKSVSQPVRGRGGARLRQGRRQEVGADAGQERQRHALRRAVRPRRSRNDRSIRRGAPPSRLAGSRRAGSRRSARRFAGSDPFGLAGRPALSRAPGQAAGRFPSRPAAPWRPAQAPSTLAPVGSQ